MLTIIAALLALILLSMLIKFFPDFVRGAFILVMLLAAYALSQSGAPIP